VRRTQNNTVCWQQNFLFINADIYTKLQRVRGEERRREKKREKERRREKKGER